MALNMFVSPDDDRAMKEGHTIINIMAKLTDHLDETRVGLFSFVVLIL